MPALTTCCVGPRLNPKTRKDIHESEALWCVRAPAVRKDIVYNGTTLTMTITDTKDRADTFTVSWNMNISSAVGAQTVFVGFTAATGGKKSSQSVDSWTYTNP
jgi:Legume lectin domain